jgi:hypothetical protein
VIRPEIQSLATPITQLKPHPQNVRQGDVGAISLSLEQHGQYRPIVVQQSTGFILAGNHTYKAAKALKWKDIAATYVDVDDEQALRILLIDNRANDLASYDDSALVEMLKALMDTELKLDGTGFDPSDLDQLLKDLEMETGNPIEGDPDAVPDDAPSKTVLGDVWLLGDHRLMCGDSSSPTDINKLTNRSMIDLLLTDPPYGINANKMTLGAGKKDFERGNSWDEETPNVLIHIGLAKQHVVWGGNYFADHLPVTNNWLCWHKKNDGRSFSEFELAWTDLDKQCRLLSHHWSGEVKHHPTMKPVKVMEWCIEQADNPQTILDLYGGSGSTLIAAHQTGRIAYLMELDPHYCDVICKRFQQATGITPIAEATGNEHSFIE